MTTKDELLQEFGTAIVNLLFDAVEDAAEDTQGDINETLSEDEAPEEIDQEALTLELIRLVTVKLLARLENADNWDDLRKLYPRSAL